MKILVTTILGFINFFTNSETLFPLDQHGKYTFSEVVEVPGMTRNELFTNGEEFVKKIKVLNTNKKYFSKDKENFILTNKGSFYVYRFGSLKKAIDGAVEYEIKLELKDGKYRYTITNFVFNEYRRNRYGKFEPVNGKFYPLEMEMTSLNQKEWEKHREVVFEKTWDLIHNLYGEMIFIEAKKSKVSPKEDVW